MKVSLSAVLAIVAGLSAMPASAAAGPLEDVTQRAAELTAPAGQTVDRASDAVPAVRETVERSAASVEPTVRAVTGARPIRSTVQAVTASVDRAAPQGGPTAAAVTERLSPSAPTASAPRQPTAGGREVGGIDRQASSRSGGAQDAPTDQGTANGATALSTPLTFHAAGAEQARSAASSTSAAGDDGGLDVGQPPFGIGGGDSLLGGPAGIALLALGLLAGLLMLVPRISTRLLHMSPSRWGAVAFLVPIERPG
ncbi:MAG TPA: hypothetical protein VEW67_01380 [Thermoleophilaceae bacterium]|nr:hypothetical protein [Thermoleophilaceae bacterium]